MKNNICKKRKLFETIKRQSLLMHRRNNVPSCVPKSSLSSLSMAIDSPNNKMALDSRSEGR